MRRNTDNCRTCAVRLSAPVFAHVRRRDNKHDHVGQGSKQDKHIKSYQCCIAWIKKIGCIGHAKTGEYYQNERCQSTDDAHDEIRYQKAIFVVLVAITQGAQTQTGGYDTQDGHPSAGARTARRAHFPPPKWLIVRVAQNGCYYAK